MSNAARNASRDRIAATRERVAQLYYPPVAYGTALCPVCGYRGATDAALRQHRRRQHREAK